MTTTTANEQDNRSESNADAHGARQRPSYDDVNVPVVFLVGVISMILTFVTIWFVEGIYYKWSNSLVQERTYDISNTIQAETVAAQKAVLDGDEEKGITSFESVIGGVVAQYQNNDSSNSGDDSKQENEAGSGEEEAGGH